MPVNLPSMFGSAGGESSYKPVSQSDEIDKSIAVAIQNGHNGDNQHEHDDSIREDDDGTDDDIDDETLYDGDDGVEDVIVAKLLAPSNLIIAALSIVIIILLLRPTQCALPPLPSVFPFVPQKFNARTIVTPLPSRMPLASYSVPPMNSSDAQRRFIDAQMIQEAQDSATAYIIPSHRHLILALRPKSLFVSCKTDNRLPCAAHIIDTTQPSPHSAYVISAHVQASTPRETSVCAAGTIFDFLLLINSNALTPNHTHILSQSEHVHFYIRNLDTEVEYNVAIANIRHAQQKDIALSADFMTFNGRFHIHQRCAESAASKTDERLVVGRGVVFNTALDEHKHEMFTLSAYLDDLYHAHIHQPITNSQATSGIPSRRLTTWERAYDPDITTNDQTSQVCSAKFWDYVDAYRQWHANMVALTSPLHGVTHEQALENARKHKIHYLVEMTKDETGLADRMITMMTSYIHAMVMQRVYVVMEPFAHHLMMMSTPALALSVPLSAPILLDKSFVDSVETHVSDSMYGGRGAEDFSTDQWQRRIIEYIWSNRGGLTHILKDKTYAPLLKSLDLTIDNAYGCLYAALFTTKVSIYRRPTYTNAWLSALTPTIKQIGLQVRTFEVDKNAPYLSWMTIKHGDDTADGDMMALYSEFVICTLDLAHAERFRHDYVNIYVISDSNRFATAFRRQYGTYQRTLLSARNQSQLAIMNATWTTLTHDHGRYHRNEPGLYLSHSEDGYSTLLYDWVALYNSSDEAIPSNNRRRHNVITSTSSDVGHINIVAEPRPGVDISDKTAINLLILKRMSHAWAEQFLYAQSSEFVVADRSGFGRIGGFIGNRRPARLFHVEKDKRILCGRDPSIDTNFEEESHRYSHLSVPDVSTDNNIQRRHPLQ